MGNALSVRKALSQPSPSDWERWEARLLAGEDPSSAAQAEGQTCSSFRRDDEVRQRALLALSREARADEADRRLEDWVVDEKASDQVRLYWHRYHANRAGRVSEHVEVDVAVTSALELGSLTREQRDVLRQRVLLEHPELLEFVAGVVEDDEPPEAAALVAVQPIRPRDSGSEFAEKPYDQEGH